MDRIVGKTPVEVIETSDEITMKFSDGTKGKWHHAQECCESVVIDDVVGDWSDLYGHPLLVAEERSSRNETEDGGETWTFYTFRSLGGSVDVKWHGASNGYYSESVDFVLLEAD
jgi:hypothetical protein